MMDLISDDLEAGGFSVVAIPWYLICDVIPLVVNCFPDLTTMTFPQILLLKK